MTTRDHGSRNPSSDIAAPTTTNQPAISTKRAGSGTVFSHQVESLVIVASAPPAPETSGAWCARAASFAAAVAVAMSTAWEGGR